MAFDAIRKELQRVVCTCYLQGNSRLSRRSFMRRRKNAPFIRSKRGRFDNFEEF